MRKSVLAVLLSTALVLSGCSKRVTVPMDSESCIGMDCLDVYQAFSDCGFTNIVFVQIEDASGRYEDGEVSLVKIGQGAVWDTWYSDNTFPSDSKVEITYHKVSAPVPSPTPEPTPSPTPAPTPEPSPVYSADAKSIKSLSEDLFSFGYSDLNVYFDDSDKTFVVSFYPTDIPSSETGFVLRGVNRYINFCRVAYGIDGVERIRFDIAASGITNKGNEVKFTGLSILMDRDEFSTFNWDNLSYLPIWDALCNSCLVFQIDPVFSQNIDTSNIFYDPYLNDGLID